MMYIWADTRVTSVILEARVKMVFDQPGFLVAMIDRAPY